MIEQNVSENGPSGSFSLTLLKTCVDRLKAECARRGVPIRAQTTPTEVRVAKPALRPRPAKMLGVDLNEFARDLYGNPEVTPARILHLWDGLAPHWEIQPPTRIVMYLQSLFPRLPLAGPRGIDTRLAAAQFLCAAAWYAEHSRFGRDEISVTLAGRRIGMGQRSLTWSTGHRLIRARLALNLSDELTKPNGSPKYRVGRSLLALKRLLTQVVPHLCGQVDFLCNVAAYCGPDHKKALIQPFDIYRITSHEGEDDDVSTEETLGLLDLQRMIGAASV